MRAWLLSRHLPATKRLLLLICALAMGPGSFASAEVGVPANQDPAVYAGPDRAAKLVAGARQEGTVMVYTSTTMGDMAMLSAAFEKKYGVPVRVWRASSEQIVQRAVTEAHGGRFDADVFETGGAAMEALHREKLLRQVTSPGLEGLDPTARTPHGEWTGTRLNIVVAAYNPRLVDKDQLPKAYDDLRDPKWKGKLGIEADDSDWFGAVIDQLGKEHGLALFRDIVAANGISVRKGHTLLANLTVSGEVPLALTTYAYRIMQLKDSGAPIDWLVIPPAIARYDGAGVARHAAHPNAAVLFFDFMLTDAQALLRDHDHFPASSKAGPLPGGNSITFLDPARSLDESREWSKYYRDVIINQAR